MKRFSIAAYISGSGSNLKKIIENTQNGFLASNVRLVISDRMAPGLIFAESSGIQTAVISRLDLPRDEFISKQLSLLKKFGIDLILLAGYIKKLPSEIVDIFSGRILNIHPALLPEFGGKGMHGLNVHEAVIRSKAEFSGPTVHFVDGKYDHGEILLQKKIRVLEGETPESLSKRVLELEHVIYSEAIKILEERKE